MKSLIIILVVFANVSCAQQRAPDASESAKNGLECHVVKKAGFCFEKTKNGQMSRELYYENERLNSATVFYESGNWAKHIRFRNNGEVESIEVFPDSKLDGNASYRRNSFTLSFAAHKLVSISDMSGAGFASFSSICKNNCDENDVFASEGALHPALSLPKNDRALGVLERNGISISKIGL